MRQRDSQRITVVSFAKPCSVFSSDPQRQGGTLEINLSAASTPRCQGQGTNRELSRILLGINHQLGEITDGKDLFGCPFPGVTRGYFGVKKK